MKVRYRKFPFLFIVFIFLAKQWLVPLTIVYAQIENDSVNQSTMGDDSGEKIFLEDSKSAELKVERSEIPQNEDMEIHKLTDSIENEYSGVVESETSTTEEVGNKDQDIQMGEGLTSEEIRFSIDVGEYLEVQKDETFGIEVTTNQTIDSLRIIIPKGTEFIFSDEKKRTHVQTYNDESSLWLITFNHESDRFPANVSVSDSGQISVEDSNGEIHSAFLYVNTGVSKRNAQILSESAARTTVTVSSWANFRTAWNNNNRTVIDATSNIPAGTTALNTRTSNVTIRSSTAFSNRPTTINTTGATLSWSGATVSTTTPVILNTGTISGTNLVIGDLSRVIVSGSASLQNLRMNNHSPPWPQLTNNGRLSINQSLVMDGSWIRTETTINVRGSVTLDNNFLIQSNSLGVLPIQTSNMVRIKSGHLGFAVWENVRFDFRTPATRFWSNLTFTLSGNSIIQSSQPTFNDSTFKLTSSVTAISTRHFSGGEGSVVMPPVPEEETKYTLSLEATPIEGGIPLAELDKIAEEESTKITANPNEGYDFIQWEIVSGTGSTLEDEISPETTFTMGSEDAVVRAVFEKEDKELEPVNPVDPLDPEVEVNPENKPELPEEQRQLSIDFVSQFNFGTQTISVQDQTYYAQSQRLLNADGTVNLKEERPNYVQISDRRNDTDRGSGWQLAVTQNKQFTSAKNQELNGAQLQFFNQQFASIEDTRSPTLQEEDLVTLIPGAKKILVSANSNSGTGTWIYRFGDGETAGESVALDVPRGANPEASIYSTTLIWELSAVPGN